MPSSLSTNCPLNPNSTGLPSRPLAIGRACTSCRLTTRVAPSGMIPLIRSRSCSMIFSVASTSRFRSLTARTSRPRRRPAAASGTPAAANSAASARARLAARRVLTSTLRASVIADSASPANSPVILGTPALASSRPSCARARNLAAMPCALVPADLDRSRTRVRTAPPAAWIRLTFAPIRRNALASRPEPVGYPTSAGITVVSARARFIPSTAVDPHRVVSFLTIWKVGGPLALTLVMIYTAGLNTGSPEKASTNFLVFAFVMGWSALISLLPFWTPVPPPPVNEDQETWELAEQGLRMGIGTTLALAISYIAGFAKIGWAPSAVGNVVRYGENLSQKRAWARFLGTLGGAAMASIALAFITDPTIVVLIGAVFAVLNGLFKLTKLGRMPLFYTATILLLYTANDLTTGSENVLTRVVYNIVGITIGMLVVIYPFPLMMRKLNPKSKTE